MKRRISEHLFAGSAMGAEGKSARRTQYVTIIVMLLAITAFSSAVFFGRFLQEKQEDQRCYVFTLYIPGWLDDGFDRYVGPEPRTHIYYDNEDYDVWYHDGVITTRPALPEEFRISVECLKVSDFGQMMRGTFLLLPVCFLIAVVAVILNYRSFYRPTKSIYVMKRMSSSREMHRRCLAIPLIGMLLAILLCIGLGVFYYWVYKNYTLPVRLPDRITFSIGRTLVWWS